MDATKEQSIRQVYAAHPEMKEKTARFFKDVMDRAATDWDFRQKLLASPNAAFADFLGVEEVPSDYQVVFIENRADVTIVLPDPEPIGAELSDEELEAVAGGEGVLASIASALAVIGSCVAVYDAWFDD